MENVITVGKFISLLLLFRLSLLSSSFLLNCIQKYKESARSPCNGNHFSSFEIATRMPCWRASEARATLSGLSVQSRIAICNSYTIVLRGYLDNCPN